MYKEFDPNSSQDLVPEKDRVELLDNDLSKIHPDERPADAGFEADDEHPVQSSQ